jgi:lipopolysaccharide export system protein LptC
MTLLFLFALFASIWFTQRSFLNREDVNISQPTTPDSFMVDMEYTGFDAAGQWSSRLKSARVTHYPDQDSSALESPKMTSRSGLLTWIISSNRGTARQGLKVVYMVDQVEVDRIHATKGKTLTLLTSTLDAYPPEKWAQTDKPVTIVQPGSTVHATGLTANLDTGDIYLLSRVEGTYASPSN